MSDVVFITYATHADGLFDKLVRNTHGVEFIVVGWGEKWIGYVESKMRGIYNLLQKLHSDMIVCYVDGFDSLVNKNLKGFKEKFIAYDQQVVFSEDSFTGGRMTTIMKFGRCLSTVLNAGMFVGYVGSLLPIFERMIISGYKDDQMYLNKLCNVNPLIFSIDTSHELFENLSDKNMKSNAFFVSYPFAVSQEHSYKLKRIMRDYSKEIVVISTVAIILIYIFHQNLRY